jgi:ABC-type multidrug transport system fused ATPase/permease subunit
MMKTRANRRNSQIFGFLGLLKLRDRKNLIAIACVQVSLAILDLLGVLAIGLLGSLVTYDGEVRSQASRVDQLFGLVGLTNGSHEAKALILGSLAAIFLVGRTVLSVIFTRRILLFFGYRAAEISTQLISRLLSQTLQLIQSRSTQQNLYSVTTGVSLIMVQVLATVMVIIADIALLMVMAVGLFIVEPKTATLTCILFISVGYFLHRYMKVRASSLGKSVSEVNIRSNEKIVEVLGSYRELVVRDRRDYYAREIGTLRIGLSKSMAELSFLPFVSKYVVESVMLIGTLIICGIQLLSQDSSQSFATLAIFLAAGTRIAPAVLRIQQGIVSIGSAIGQASPTMDLIQQLGSEELNQNLDDSLHQVHDGFIPDIDMQGVTFKYPQKDTYAIQGFSLLVKPGSSVAFVGPSGAGKSTIVDLMLGILKPESGTVTISGLPPLQAIRRWSGAIAYVPQDVSLSAGTIRENVVLGYPKDIGSEKQIREALDVAGLLEFVEGLPKGLDTEVGERGARLSGGQRQRLGIARAMITHPQLLVLDEATSSLDAETEDAISRSISKLHGNTTVVMIAHRLSMVRKSDIIVYMNEGKILAQGSFEELKSLVPEFRRQANLMGL